MKRALAEGRAPSAARLCARSRRDGGGTKLELRTKTRMVQNLYSGSNGYHQVSPRSIRGTLSHLISKGS